MAEIKEQKPATNNDDGDLLVEELEQVAGGQPDVNFNCGCGEPINYIAGCGGSTDHLTAAGGA